MRKLLALLALVTVAATAQQLNYSGTAATGVSTTQVPGQTQVDGALGVLYTYASTLTNGGCVNPVAGTNTYNLILNCVIGEQGYLNAASTTSLQLCPHKGSSVFINGAVLAIPSACVAISNSGLVASTYYYVYAYSNSGSIALEINTTAHSTNTTYGYEQKQGDSTRALVGAAYTDSGVLFQDTATQRYVVSWFNQQQKRCINTFTTGRATSSGSYAEVNAEIECKFIILGPPSLSGAVAKPLIWHTSGTMTNGTIADGCAVSAGFDSASAQTEQTSYANVASLTGNAPFGLAGTVTTITETGGTSGLHYITLVAKVLTGGTCTFASAYASIEVDVWQ